MDTRAAVAFEPGKPLQIETVQLNGPKEGEVLVEPKATAVCHTDEFTRSVVLKDLAKRELLMISGWSSPLRTSSRERLWSTALRRGGSSLRPGSRRS